jgi:hypothetical protein
MTSLWRSGLTPHCLLASAQFFSTQEMVFQICLLPRKLIFSSPRRAKVLICSSPFESRHSTNLITDLVTYCQRRGTKYTTFRDWTTILETTQAILAGEVTASDVAEGRYKPTGSK